MALKKLDVRGAKCPIPIVKAKKEIDAMAPGEQLEVTATDPGSVPDFQGWVKTAKHVVLREQRTEKDATGRELYIHVVERTG
jgi:TusA-related sulfurtransferase